MKKNIIEKPPEWFNIDLSKNILFYDHESFKIKKNSKYFKKDNNLLSKYVKSNIKTNFKLKKNPKINKKKILKKIKDQTKKKIDKIINDNSIDDKKKITKIKTLNTKMDKKINNIDTVIKSKHYNLNLNIGQKQIIQKWIFECRRLYNFCVDKFNKNPSFFNKSYMKLKLIIFEEIYRNNKKEAPYDMLTDEVRIFCSNIKSCYTNLKNNNIKHFTMNKRTHKSYSLLIPAKSITKNSIFIRQFGIINGFDMNLNNYCDSRLYYDSIFNRYILKIPIYEKIKNKKLKRHKIVALDPGEKIFMTFHGLRTYGYIGKNIRKPILKLQKKIKKIQRILSKKKNKKNKKLKNKKGLVKKKGLLYRKKKNIVKELHNQTALFLCKKYKKILIPKFRTQTMIKNYKKTFKEYKKDFINKGKTLMEKKNRAKYFTKRTRLNKNVKFVLQQLSHYSFRQHLINKSIEYGCQVRVITEEFTSKTCTKCGYQSNNYNKRLKECNNCQYKVDRDINGARNILLKNLSIFLL